jgi:TIR domain
MGHDIFISYAWVDNEVYPGSEKGWVSTFVDGLRKHLARELGRSQDADRLWLDYEQMRGNQGLSPTIRTNLEGSRTLVLILSKGYLTSRWCRQELATFLAKVGTGSGRVFVVQMSPVEDEPEPLLDLLKYRFWYLDEHRQPCTRWFPDVDPTDREYPREQQRLARDLAGALRGMDGAADIPTAISRTSGSTPRETPPCNPWPKPASSSGADGDRFILVNGGTEDRELVAEIAKRLGQRNLSVALPLSLLVDQSQIKSSTLTRDFRGKLSLCDAVLMVYRHGPMDQVSQHLIECLKACTKAHKDKHPPTIDLCQTQSNPLALGLQSNALRIHVVGESCAEECVEWFLEEIAA